jgi:hypothetical protein
MNGSDYETNDDARRQHPCGSGGGEEEKKLKRFNQLTHAMQSGVSMQLSDEVHPSMLDSIKHLRVGINSCMTQLGALSELLVEKEIITDGEYLDKLIEKMSQEVKRLEDELSEKMGGVRVHLF